MPQVLACGSREVLFVTAFEETGRSAFARYKRSNDNYRASFRALAEALNAYITKDPLVAYDDILWMGLPANTVVLPVANVLYIFKIRVWEVGTASAPEPTTSRR